MATRSQVRLVVFDLDGTLIDSRRDLAESANALLHENGCAPHSEEAIGRMVGEGAATLVARAFASAGATPPPGALARFLEIYDARLLEHTRPYEGVETLLRELEPTCRLAVLTNKPLGATREILQGLGLSGFFGGGVLGGDGPLPRKPDPAGLLQLMHQAGASGEQALLVGDSLVDWQTAKAAGAGACMAAYGFGFESFPREQLEPSDVVIRSPLELTAHL